MIKLNIPIIITLLNEYFIGFNILYSYDNINNDLFLIKYYDDKTIFKKLTIKQLINDFKYYILSDKYYKNKSLKLLNKITFFK